MYRYRYSHTACSAQIEPPLYRYLLEFGVFILARVDARHVAITGIVLHISAHTADLGYIDFGVF